MQTVTKISDKLIVIACKVTVVRFLQKLAVMDDGRVSLYKSKLVKGNVIIKIMMINVN